MGETLERESRRGNLPVPCSVSHFLYIDGISKTGKELEIIDLDFKAIHFVSA